MPNFVRKLANNGILTPHIDRIFAANEWPDRLPLELRMNKEEDTYFHPSGDCAPCERELFAKFCDDLPKREVNSTSIKNFTTGHFWHELLGYIIVERLGYSVSSFIEKKLDFERNGWKAVGSADVARCDIPGLAPFLVDFKTMNSIQFNMATIPESLTYKWRLQTLCYVDWMRRLGHNDINKAIVICIQKDTPHAFKEIVFDYDNELVEDIYDKWDFVHTCLMNDEVPSECEHERAGQYCPVADLYELGTK